MSYSLIIPLSIAAKTRAELSKLFLKLQAHEAAKVQIISIYFDTEAKEHVCWYYPTKIR